SETPIVNELYQLSMSMQPAPDKELLGTVTAIDASTGKNIWTHEQRANMLSVMTTGGGLVFGGDTNRRFMAFDQENGEVVWETILGGPVNGFPVTYAVDGVQYVAVATGNSGVSGGLLPLTPEFRSTAIANVL